MVAVCLIYIEVFVSGPDIDGRTPSLVDTIQIFAIDGAIVLGFALSAIGLFRWPDRGWWLSVALDALLGLVAISMILGDFRDRFTVTQDGRDAFRGDMILHTAILLPCLATIGSLLIARSRFLAKGNAIPPLQT
jgi:hypothetical protein